MNTTELCIGLTLLVFTTLFSTAIVALQQMSRVRLSEILEDWADERVNRLAAMRDELIFCFSFIRLSSILVLVMLIDHITGMKTGSRSSVTVQYALVFVVSLALTTFSGVAIPIAWARYGGDAFLARGLTIMFFLRRVLSPLAVLQRLFDTTVRRLAGIPKGDEWQEEADQLEKEILGAVSEGELAGAVHENEADMIESVLAFRDTSVNEIMTPRTEIAALPADATLAQTKDLISETGHSRIPVYIDTIDNIQGVLYAKDLLRLDGNLAFKPLDLMRKVPFVPEGKHVSDLLAELKQQKVHLAIVLDEYGGTAGLITIEDILEEIVGEIADEYEEAEPDPMRRIDENTLEVDARVHIDEVNEELGIKLPEGEDYDTVGGFVFSSMGKIPTTGEEMRFSNVRLLVIDAQERKINRLRIEMDSEASSA